MKKFIFLSFIVFLGAQSTIFANAGVSISADPSYAHVFAYNHVDAPGGAWNTINDWAKIGGTIYSNYFTLTSDTAIGANTITDWASAPAHELRTDLEIDADDPSGQGNPYSVPMGTWAGYEWTLPAGYETETIVKFKIAGFFSVSTTLAELRLLDDSNNVIANITEGFTSGGWINPAYTQEWLIPNGTSSVKVVLYWKAGGNVWNGNYVWLYMAEMTTAPIVPKCGDAGHPHPIGDISKDCVVDFTDFSILAANWMADTTANDLMMFGYYFVASGFGNGIQDLCGWTNFNHMYFTAQNAIDSAACGAKIVVGLRWYFFDSQGGLLADLSNWNALALQMMPYKENIGAFYVMDEPFWNNVSYADLEAAVNIIKTSFPNLPVMTTIAYPVINSSLAIPPNLDYIGFDQYDNFSAIPPLLSILKTKIHSGQKIFLVPQAHKGVSSDAQVAAWAYDYYNLALSDPVIAGMLVFLWPDLSAQNPVLAPAGPLTRAAFEDIGSMIIR